MSSDPELVGIGGGGGPGGGGGGPDPAEGPDGNPLSSFATGPWKNKCRQQSHLLFPSVQFPIGSHMCPRYTGYPLYSLSNKAWFYSFSPLPKDPTQLFSTFAFFLWPLRNSKNLKCVTSISDSTSPRLSPPSPAPSPGCALTPLSLFQRKTLAPKLGCSIFSESSNPLSLIKSFLLIISPANSFLSAP